MKALRPHLRKLRYRALNPARYIAERAAQTLSRPFATGRGRLRVLVLSDAEVITSEEQLNPLAVYREELRKKYGIVSLHVLLGDALRAPAAVLAGFDAIFLKMSFRSSRERVLNVVQTLKAAAPRSRLLYFDGDDDLCVQWPEMLPFVDMYVKKHLFRDRTLYTRVFAGKSNLTDYVHRKHGVSFAEDPIAKCTSPIAQTELPKLVIGSNLATDKAIMQLFTANLDTSGERDTDVMFRGNVPRDWISFLRRDIEPALESLRGDFRVIVPRERVDRTQYLREMLSSKICLSPYGYGEICWRDFEAVLCGCLLIKPDMGHVETFPDIFQPHETYVPVKWDYSDLDEKCRYYLTHPEERRRIAAKASGLLHDFYRHAEFGSHLSALLKQAAM